MQAPNVPTAQWSSSSGTLTLIEQAVFESVAYSDIFDYPVTAAEVHRALTIEASLDQVERVLRSERLVPPLLTFRHPYFCLAGREHVFETRQRRRRHSTRLMRLARAYGALIAHLPFVRMVAVTGSLAVENAEADDDIDYLIVTSPGRVWTARAFTMLTVRVAALKGITLCPNYILSEDALALDQHDLYTARELVQMQSIAGYDTHMRLLDANPWRSDFLPNVSPTIDAPRLKPRPWYQRALEALLSASVGDRFERWIFERKSAELRREAGANDEAVFDRTMCKGHFDRHRTRATASLAARIRSAEEARK